MKYLYHYLDDFITCGSPGTRESQDNMQVLLECCSQLGVPIAQEKIEGPTISLTFLGIEMDTLAMELWLPATKLAKVHQSVSGWLGKNVARRRNWSH